MDAEKFDDLIAQLASSFIRHWLGIAAGALGTAGVLNPDQQTQFISIGLAVALYLLAQGWSFIRKIKRAKA